VDFLDEFKMQHHRVDPQLKMTSHVDNVVRWTGLRGEVFQIAAIKENIFKVSMYPRGDPPLDRTWIASNNLEMDLDGYPRENFDRFQPLPKMHLEEGDGHLLLSSGKVQVKVNDGTCRLSWSYENACFACDSVLGSYAYEVDGPSFHQMERLKEENYYGLGEVSGTLNRGGRRFRMTCKDAMGYDAQTTDPLYKHFPMITTLNTKHHIASAVLYDNFGDGTIDLGKEISAFRGSYRYYQADSGFIDYYFIIGPSMAQVSDLAGSLVGRPAVPPRWALGYVASTMTYADSDNAQERLEEFPSLCKKFEMPCTGFYLSSGYTMDTHGNRNVFTWNRERIPSPENMLNAFTSSGIHVIANIKPWLLEHHPKFQSMSQLLVHTTSASWFWKGGPGTFAKGLYLDFTNPETCTWWEAQIEEQLVAKGVTAIWNDNNEFEIDDSSAPCHFKHMPIGLLGRPLLQLLMARSSFHALKKYSQRPLVVTRSACLGTFRFAAQTWSGDNTTSFHTMKWNIPMSLGLGLVGFVGNGADIGGFTGEKVSQELFLRWIQMGIYMPRFSIHSSSWKGNNEDKYNLSGTNEPWMFPEIENNVRELLKLRYRLVPLLLSLHLEGELFSFLRTFLNIKSQPRSTAIR